MNSQTGAPLFLKIGNQFVNLREASSMLITSGSEKVKINGIKKYRVYFYLETYKRAFFIKELFIDNLSSPEIKETLKELNLQLTNLLQANQLLIEFEVSNE